MMNALTINDDELKYLDKNLLWRHCRMLYYISSWILNLVERFHTWTEKAWVLGWDHGTWYFCAEKLCAPLFVPSKVCVIDTDRVLSCWNLKYHSLPGHPHLLTLVVLCGSQLKVAGATSALHTQGAPGSWVRLTWQPMTNYTEGKGSPHIPRVVCQITPLILSMSALMEEWCSARLVYCIRF